MMAQWKQFLNLTADRPPNATNFPGLPDCLTWVRIFVGLTYGLSLALRGVEGSGGLLLGSGLITFLPHMYVEHMLKADVTTYKNLIMVGVPNAMATMLLVWIALHTLRHEEEERALTSLLLESAAKVLAEDAGVDDGDDVASASTVKEEDVQSEF